MLIQTKASDQASGTLSFTRCFCAKHPVRFTVPDSTSEVHANINWLIQSVEACSAGGPRRKRFPG